MKLYYSAGACSLAPHICLREVGADFTLEKVDLKAKQFAGGDYLKINAKGLVPALDMKDGGTLTEGTVICRYIADQFPGRVAPPAGSLERLRCDEWLNFAATDLHKNFTPLFGARSIVSSPEAQTELTNSFKATLQKKYAVLGRHLGDHAFLGGSDFSIADAYVFVTLRWAKAFHIEVPANVDAYVERVRARPTVAAALDAEGLKR